MIDRQLLAFSEYMPIESVFVRGEDYLKVKYPDTSIVFKRVYPKRIRASCINGIDF